MTVSELPFYDPHRLDRYGDLRSLPRLRHFGKNDVIERFRRSVPFDYLAVLGLDFDRYRVGQELCLDTNLPPAYMEAYEADRLYETDPFFRALKTSKTVVIEHDVYALSPPPARLLYLHETFRVFNRTAFPQIRDDVVYSAVGFTRVSPFDREELHFLELIAPTVHKIVTKPIVEKFAAAHLKLTHGEIECLRCASLGHTSGQVAEQTGYQVDTVNTYIISATRKLGATNRTHAVAEAIRRGILR
ncbi:helix-turn-helix transcriptional regulator [Rhizobium sp. P28RR-XV]|uniref:helix-turn-helix transcriptional regulator n=1 Tax=Rhizobium sp. P28RR-XV TaxID=2726737 RepID=UPI00145786E4|nr:LuxR family transcriptional regulator [Rhizobium sp. P28RR-XV]NLR88395.1 LuxR family transcriptional regulator [Rhizobium sp. P28RR-XV]